MNTYIIKTKEGEKYVVVADNIEEAEMFYANLDVVSDDYTIDIATEEDIDNFKKDNTYIFI